MLFVGFGFCEGREEIVFFKEKRPSISVLEIMQFINLFRYFNRNLCAEWMKFGMKHIRKWSNNASICTNNYEIREKFFYYLLRMSCAQANAYVIALWPITKRKQIHKIENKTNKTGIMFNLQHSHKYIHIKFSFSWQPFG